MFKTFSLWPVLIASLLLTTGSAKSNVLSVPSSGKTLPEIFYKAKGGDETLAQEIIRDYITFACGGGGISVPMLERYNGTLEEYKSQLFKRKQKSYSASMNVFNSSSKKIEESYGFNYAHAVDPGIILWCMEDDDLDRFEKGNYGKVVRGSGVRENPPRGIAILTEVNAISHTDDGEEYFELLKLLPNRKCLTVLSLYNNPEVKFKCTWTKANDKYIVTESFDDDENFQTTYDFLLE